ncbi:MAG TPA: TonB family protein [Blastocatellia bacterium]|nr:TonB family protein [Blastocatellia bacterium]
MKSLFFALAITLSFFLPAIAQTTSTPSQNDGSKSAELREASSLSAQVVELYNKNRYDEALPIAKRVIEIRERLLGAGDPLVGDALQNLGSIYSGKKNYGEALSLYKRALSIFEKALGPENAKTANTLHNLGWLYYAQGDPGKAEESFQRSLAVREKLSGPNHNDVAVALDMLAQFYQQQIKYAKAADYYKRALAVKEKAFGPDHKQVGEAAMKCACAMMQDGRQDEATALRIRGEMILSGKRFDPNEFIPGSVLQGHAVYRAKPEYPMAAKRAAISGSVIVEVTVDENGKVLEAKSLCGPNALVETAVKAAYDWKFSPTLLNGKPVKVKGTITFNFNL